jgi:SAM-dependent methyltransferase
MIDPEAASFYDDMWQKYAHLDAVSPAAFHRRRLVVGLARRYAPGARAILDVGCGPGHLLKKLAEHFPAAEVTGADLSRQAATHGEGLDLLHLDLSDPSFEQRHAERLGRYDLVTCSEVLEHIENDGQAVHRLASLLTPGGILIVTVPGGKMSRYDQVIGHHRHYERRHLEGLLRRAGLEVQAVLGWGFPFHNVYRSAVRIASRATIGRDHQERSESGVIGSALGRAYTLFGRSLRPLYYLNLARWGEQMIGVARKPR